MEGVVPRPIFYQQKLTETKVIQVDPQMLIPLDPGVPSFSYIKDPTGEPYSGMLAVYPPGGRV